VTFHVVTSPEGRRGYQVGFHHQRPVASALFAVYALPQGIVVAPLPMGGIGSPWPPPPVPGCFPVFIASDSEGMFGHKCPECSNYWRARFSSSVCPYCGFHGNVQDFLTDAQRRYVHQYCELLQNALTSEQDGDHVIDMDAVARRQKLLASQNLVAGLGIPLKRRPDAASTYTAREIKRKLGPKMPPATAGALATMRARRRVRPSTTRARPTSSFDPEIGMSLSQSVSSGEGQQS